MADTRAAEREVALRAIDVENAAKFLALEKEAQDATAVIEVLLS